MKVKLLIAALVVIALGQSAHATGLQPVPVYTFLCSGNVQFRYGKCPQGGRPDVLLAGSDGKLYGTTQVSEEGDSDPLGGTIFSYTADGKGQVLYTFQPGAGNTYPNGDMPSGLIEGPDGKLYGSTLSGGSTGYGLLFRINRDGSDFTIVHTFCSSLNCADGVGGTLSVIGADGDLYGAGSSGGAYGYGVIYRVIPSTGEYDVVFNFTNALSDSGPSFGVILGSGGILYGLQGNELFQYNPANGDFSETTLPFPLVNGLPSGPATGLTIGPNGNLCGLYAIYSSPGVGVFEVNTDGSNFQFLPAYDPNFIHSGPIYMMLASDQNFWVTEYIGGSSDGGAIVKVSPTTGGLLATEATFSSTGNTGAYPDVLIQLKNKTFVGATTQYGTAASGHFADGVIFHLNAGL